MTKTACDNIARKNTQFRNTGGQEENIMKEFPGGPVVKTWRFHCRGPGFDPWLGN